MIDYSRLNTLLDQQSADVEGRLDTYISEANFFRRVIQGDIDELSPNSRVLEVGCGVGVLSLLVGDLGFRVSAVDPQSADFGQMYLMRQIVEGAWMGEVPYVQWVNGDLSSLEEEQGKFEYVYAINVVEHVNDVPEFVSQCVKMLRPGGVFRFVCPNYSLPYEPHFNMPTLFSKRLTRWVLARKIANSRITDPAGLWDELSWPTQRQLVRTLKEFGLPYRFNSLATRLYVERASQDAHFTERKGRTFALLGDGLSLIPSHLYSRIPDSILPIIDCTVVRPGTWQGTDIV